MFGLCSPQGLPLALVRWLLPHRDDVAVLESVAQELLHTAGTRDAFSCDLQKTAWLSPAMLGLDPLDVSSPARAP